MSLALQRLQRYRNPIIYASVLAAMVFVLKWLQWKYLITDNSMEIYAGLVAILFTALGLWLATRLSKSKTQTVIIEKEIFVSQDSHLLSGEALTKEFNLTSRELEVLNLLIQGRSNAEIADKLFLSVSTIKTHVSNLFSKMNVKSRTQAIQKAHQSKRSA